MSPTAIIFAALLACPPFPPDGEDHVWTLPEGCPAPYELQAYTTIADLKARQGAAKARVELRDLRAELVRCRAERDAFGGEDAGALEAGGDRAEVVATTIAAVPLPAVEPVEAPSRTRWAGAAVLGALLGGVAVYAALEQAGGRLQDLGALGGAALGGGLVVGVGGLLE